MVHALKEWMVYLLFGIVHLLILGVISEIGQVMLIIISFERVAHDHNFYALFWRRFLQDSHGRHRFVSDQPVL